MFVNNMNLPPYLLQAMPGQETDACEAFSFTNEFWKATGFLISPVALAVDSDLSNPNNRNAQTILSTVKNIGVVAYADCPLPSPLTVSAFYAVKTSGLQHHKFDISEIAPDFSKWVWTALEWGQNLPIPTRHMVAVIDANGDFVDSEPGGQIKNLKDPTVYGAPPALITWQSSLIINNPLMNIYTVVKQDGKTFGVCVVTPNGAQIIFATTEDQWRSWNSPTSYAAPTVNADGTTNWTASYQLPF